MNGSGVIVAYLHDERVSHCFMDALMNAGATGVIGGRLPVRVTAGDVGGSRDRAAAAFLRDTDAAWLLMLDTDIGFLPDAPARLLEVADPAGLPVVAGLYHGVAEGEPDGCGGYEIRPYPLAFTWSPETGLFDSLPEFPADEVIRVDGAGAGMMLMHRSVLERVQEKNGVWFERTRLGGGPLMSEDLSFCCRLASIDVPVHVHTGVRGSHHKGCWVS